MAKSVRASLYHVPEALVGAKQLWNLCCRNHLRLFLALAYVVMSRNMSGDGEDLERVA